MTVTNPQPPKTDKTALKDPSISVIIPTFQLSRLGYVQQCIQSIQDQTYDVHEILVIADNTDEDETGRTIADYLEAEYDSTSLVTVIPDTEKHQVTAARNVAAQQATGDVYAFIDDDVVCEDDLLEQLAKPYEDGHLAVGGKANPVWMGDEPWTLPPELWWLVGVTHRGFVHPDYEDEVQYVRNTYACNFSVRADVFHEMDGFRVGLGKDYGHNYQGEEADFGIRLQEKYGKGMLYVPTAVVHHRVFPIQETLSYILDRSFWQGFAKAQMFPSASEEESRELEILLLDALPSYAQSSPRRALAVLLVTAAVGIGFFVGLFKRIVN